MSDTTELPEEWWELKRVAPDLNDFNISPAKAFADMMAHAVYELLSKPGVQPEDAVFTINKEEIFDGVRRYVVKGTAPKYPVMPDTMDEWTL